MQFKHCPPVTRVAGPEGPQHVALTIADRPLAIAREEGRGVAINGTIPGPLLDWQEGRDVVIEVNVRLAEDTSTVAAVVFGIRLVLITGGK